MLTSNEIRQQYIEYFVKKHNHLMIPSSPVVPHNDPTLLFANAGMNQFKDVFLGTGSREHNRVANTQKCIRAGGKHNDLEDVGKDTYHHTFFEMLGNWSFGDYFKREAIEWAWDLLTNVWGLPKDRLHATVFGGDEGDGLAADEEAAALWQEVTDIDPANIHRCSKKDNFWEMGDTGPCGPCSEIHIDLTPDKTGRDLVNADDARVIEIWNLVFMEFNRSADGTLTTLPAQHVDTGMGFERICAVLQGKTSNYDTDVFTPIFDAIRQITGAREYTAKLDDPIDMAYRVLADHIRCLTFALTDGAVPSNDGRGYVLRRILRRAIRHGRQTLGVKEPFFYKLAQSVVDSMGDVFPELTKNAGQVAEIIKDEEISFGKTIDRGIALFDEAAYEAGNHFLQEEKDKYANNDSCKKKFLAWCHEQSGGAKDTSKYWNAKEFNWTFYPFDGRPQIPDSAAFKLHDTFGFPLDLTEVMAEENGMTVDVAGFEKLMEEARELARSGGSTESDGKPSLIDIVQQQSPPATTFHGYETTSMQVNTSLLVYNLEDGIYRKADSVSQGQRVAVATGQSPFYAEAGGQVGDKGTITAGGKVRVDDTVKVGETYFHLGEVTEGSIASGDSVDVDLQVDANRRSKIVANHTSTHMLNFALRKFVNPEADQKGSLVDDEKLRFDFSNNHAVNLEQIEQLEKAVNDQITADMPVYFDFVPVEQGRSINGLRAVFGEKYPPNVRVLSIGVPVADLVADPDNADWPNYSIEFCGGTHMNKTGDAEGLVIISEDAIAKGVRRITALTGQLAHEAAAKGEMLLNRATALADQPVESLSDQINKITTDMAEQTLPVLAAAKIREALTPLQKKVKKFEKEKAKQSSSGAIDQAREIADNASGNIIVATLDGADGNALRSAMDVIRKKQPDAAMLLAAAGDDKVAFLAAVPEALIKQGLKAGDWVREVAKVTGGGGGGRPDMAQAGGKDPSKLDDALKAGQEFAESKLS